MTNVIYDSTTVATVGYVETKEQRAIYNRRAREKRKAYVEGLETEVETLKNKVTELEKENHRLQGVETAYNALVSICTQKGV